MKTAVLTATVLAGLASVPAHAAQVISSTIEITISADNADDFTGAGAVYSQSISYAAGPAFNESFDFRPAGNAQNITFQNGPGGVTVTPPAGSYGPPDVWLNISSDGTAGSWSGSYTSAIIYPPTAASSILRYRVFLGFNAIDIYSGGNNLGALTGDEFNGIVFNELIHIPGKRSVHDFNYFVNLDKWQPQVSYDSSTDITTLELFNSDYISGDEPGIVIAHAGEYVPEPACWTMLIAGFIGIGGKLRARRGETQLITA